MSYDDVFEAAGIAKTRPSSRDRFHYGDLRQLVDWMNEQAGEQRQELFDAAAQAWNALLELSGRPAFAGDAPEFSEGGVGHEACCRLKEIIYKIKGA